MAHVPVLPLPGWLVYRYKKILHTTPMKQSLQSTNLASRPYLCA
jgi:hypothetical protein